MTGFNFIHSIPLTRPVLLILDGHASHVTINVIKLAHENNIHLLCLPAHTSHILQPLDVGVFYSFKINNSKACKKYIINEWLKSAHPGSSSESRSSCESTKTHCNFDAMSHTSTVSKCSSLSDILVIPERYHESSKHNKKPAFNSKSICISDLEVLQQLKDKKREKEEIEQQKVRKRQEQEEKRKKRELEKEAKKKSVWKRKSKRSRTNSARLPILLEVHLS